MHHMSGISLPREDHRRGMIRECGTQQTGQENKPSEYELFIRGSALMFDGNWKTPNLNEMKFLTGFFLKFTAISRTVNLVKVFAQILSMKTSSSR